MISFDNLPRLGRQNQEFRAIKAIRTHRDIIPERNETHEGETCTLHHVSPEEMCFLLNSAGAGVFEATQKVAPRNLERWAELWQKS